MKPEVSMTQIIEWLNQHNINAVNAISTVVILLLASIVIPILSRLLNQWLTYLQSPQSLAGLIHLRRHCQAKAFPLRLTAILSAGAHRLSQTPSERPNATSATIPYSCTPF